MSDCSACEIGDRVHGRDLHRLVDLRGADVERAAEDEREAEDVVDLVRIVRAPGGEDRIGPRSLRHVGPDFGLGIGERENQRRLRHRLDHLGLQDAAGGKAEEHVRARNRLGESPRLGFLGVARLDRVHLLGAARVDDALDVGDEDVGERQAERHQKIEAGERGGTGA